MIDLGINLFQEIAALGGGGGYPITNSLRFNDNDSAYLSRTPATAGNRKTFTWSAWVKRGNIVASATSIFNANTTTSSDNDCALFFRDTSVLQFSFNNSGVNIGLLQTSQVFRDVSGWYHIIIVFDTGNATASERMKIYVNGARVTNFTVETYPPLNAESVFNSAIPHSISALRPTSPSDFFDGYLAEINFIDGQAITPDDFGEINEDTGEWSPIPYAGTYGTNGFYLPFDGNANDSSGNGNNWTENNLASTDYMIDTPTNNFSVWNPLAVSTASFSQGNLNAVMSSSTPAKITSTFAVSSGKYFMEYEHKGNSDWPVGISADAIQRNYLGASDGNTSISFWCSTSSTSVFINGVSQSFSGSATTWISGDIVGVALDADNQEVSLYKNGTLVGSSVSYSAYGWSQAFFAAGNYLNGNQYISNFGADSSFAGNKTRQGNTDANGIGDFYYTPPAGGYLALCTDNLPEPAIVQPETQFKTVLYTGDGTADKAITGVGFQPDMVWIKSRSNAFSHNIYDSVRGVSKRIQPNLTNAESSPISGVKSFDADGFTLGNDTDDTNFTSGNTYVAWCWKAGGTAVSNTDGSITSQVSANVDAGFSIVSYTGTGSAATVGHGLGVAPSMIIVKNRSASTNWHTFHTSLGPTKFLVLNSTSAENTASSVWNNTAPNASVFSIADDGNNNGSGQSIIAYCFHSVEGFSKFGSYVGNGSTNGTFVYTGTGFKPAFVMIKRTDSTSDWVITDNKRNPENVVNKRLFPNLSSSESSASNLFDYTANGFKLRSSDAFCNASGGTYIYMAFAEHPFKYATGR